MHDPFIALVDYMPFLFDPIYYDLIFFVPPKVWVNPGKSVVWPQAGGALEDET